MEFQKLSKLTKPWTQPFGSTECPWHWGSSVGSRLLQPELWCDGGTRWFGTDGRAAHLSSTSPGHWQSMVFCLFFLGVHSGNPTWQWTIHHSWMISHCHVWFRKSSTDLQGSLSCHCSTCQKRQPAFQVPRQATVPRCNMVDGDKAWHFESRTIQQYIGWIWMNKVCRV